MLDNAGHNLTTQDPTQELDTGPRSLVTLCPTNEELSPGFRPLVTLPQVHDNRDAGHILSIDEDLSTDEDPTEELDVEPRIAFTLFPINEPLPPGYRLVTVHEVHEHRVALKRAMPEWEIANLADGSVDGMEYGGCTRLVTRDDVGHQLATQDPCATSMEDMLDDADHKLPTDEDPTEELDAEPGIVFSLFPINKPLPPGYRLVSVREVQDNRQALRRAMPDWEIANLADGSVRGMEYDGSTRLDRRVTMSATSSQRRIPVPPT